MNASKENARKAKELIQSKAIYLTGDVLNFAVEFLEAAERKLPREVSYQRQVHLNKPRSQR